MARKIYRPLLRVLYELNRLRWRLTRPITVGVRLLLVQDDNVLLVKHTYQPYWYLPGGGVKKGETLEESARREAAEELGADLGPLRIFGIYTSFFEHKTDHIVVFSSTDFGLAGASSPEIECVDVFDLANLPGDVSPGSLRRIREFQNRDVPIVGTW